MKNFFCCWLLVLLAIFSAGCNNKKVAVEPAKTGNEYVILDVRTADEFRSGHIRGAVNIPHDMIDGRILAVVPDKATELKIYCRSGRRVKIAMESLKKLGYNNLTSLGGVHDAQKILDLPIVKD